jgi:hypothetical protein
VLIGAIADHGTSSNAQETTSNMVPIDFDLVIHAGDISYANGAGSGNGVGDQSVWDEYQNQIERIASKSPHMYAPGNHEEDAEPSGFDAYESRFYTTGSNSFWYSFDFEYVHFISISSEHDYENKMDIFKIKTIPKTVAASSIESAFISIKSRGLSIFFVISRSIHVG